MGPVTVARQQNKDKDKHSDHSKERMWIKKGTRAERHEVRKGKGDREEKEDDGKITITGQ